MLDAEKKAIVYKLNKLLKSYFGEAKITRQPDPLDQLILTILSQNTSDHNRDLAFAELKRRYPDWEQAAGAKPDDLAHAIRAGGLANQKSYNILNILKWLKTTHNEYSLNWLEKLPLEEAITQLTGFKGVGVKTAAVVLCFCFKAEVFPVDVHIHRICRRLRLVPESASAEKTHYLMQPLIPEGEALSLHLNMLKLGRIFCRPRNPNCKDCPVQEICPSAIK
jgi:endonuclease-3